VNDKRERERERVCVNERETSSTCTVADVILKAVADAATIHPSVKEHIRIIFQKKKKMKERNDQFGVNRFHTNGEQTDH